MLSQDNRPIAYLSKAIRGKKEGLSAYEKEFLAILMAVQKWRHYLSPNKFLIKTDHQSLKFLMEQRISTPMQQKGMIKLLGLDYSIIYRKGRENVAEDALSRRDLEEGELTAVLVVVPS